MNIKRSLIAVSVIGILMGNVLGMAVAKQVDKDDSVRKWGRWAVLSPAAGQEEVGFNIPTGNDLGSCQSAANCPTVVINEEPTPPVPEPTCEDLGNCPGPVPIPVSPCEPGAPCGFARIDYPYESTLDGREVSPDSSEITKAQLFLVDGEVSTAQLVLDPTTGTSAGLDSGELDTMFYASDFFLAMTDGAFLAGVNEEEDPVFVGPWEIGTSGGEYVWGTAASAADMDRLRLDFAGNLIATYTGTSAGSDNRSELAVILNIDFTDRSWSGSFNDSQFAADGVVVDSGFVSTGVRDGASSGLVHGVFVNAGNNAIGAYDVELTAGGRATDIFSTRLQVLD